MKTAELTGAALDWAVAKAEGWKDWVAEDEAFTWAPDGCGWLSLESYKPSTNWAQGGPIIERERIGIDWETYDTGDITDGIWIAGVHTPPQGMCMMEDFSPLVAAMRCYVASKLGEELVVPNELTGE